MNHPLPARLSAHYSTFAASRLPEADEDIHMLPDVVALVIERCTAPGNLVADPFAGFGTTLRQALRLNRRALGVELLPERVALMQTQLPHARVIEGDAREFLALCERMDPPQERGSIDLILTSPPYMSENDHPEDPLTAYEQEAGSYLAYLRELQLVALQCALMLRPDGYLVWNVADIHYRGHTTTLIADCQRELSKVLSFVGRTDIVWDHYPHDLVADALLVFQPKIHL